MQRGFGGTVFEPVQHPVQNQEPDRELTLGPATLGLLALGLVALCVLCFVFGYAMGHRNSELASGASSVLPGTTAFGQSGVLGSKPAAGQSGYQPQPVSAAANQSASTAAETPASGASAATPVSTPQSGSASPGSSTEPAAIHTVLTSQSPAQPAPANGAVQTAIGQSSGVMVQIAAVSRPEDAEVLVGALRRRGYAATSRRDPTDGLLHVQIGPFANRNEAYSIRQKLLNDGYNAIIQ